MPAFQTIQAILISNIFFWIGKVLVPTILTDDFREVEEKISFLKGKVDRVQIDIIDGRFVDNKTIEVDQLMGLVEIEEDNLLFDLHLMVDDPVSYLEKDLPGATDFVIGQIEKMGSQVEFCRQAKERGFKPGLALDLETSVSRLKLQALDWCEQVLILGVKAGFSGQKFDSRSLKKIRELAKWRRKERWDFEIGVDGGLNEEAISQCQEVGGEIFYVGGAIWKAKDPGEEIEKLKALLHC